MTKDGRRNRAGGDEAAAAGLTGTGPSQLGVDGSMRTRDVSRPSDAQLAEAERIVQVSYRTRPRVIPPATAEASRPVRTPSTARSDAHGEAPS